jgi:hypothetical protein
MRLFPGDPHNPSSTSPVCASNRADDDYGRPYIVIRDQETKTRLKGLQAQKANILAARAVTNILRTSLGPKGASGLFTASAPPRTRAAAGP